MRYDDRDSRGPRREGGRMQGGDRRMSGPAHRTYPAHGERDNDSYERRSYGSRDNDNSGRRGYGSRDNDNSARRSYGERTDYSEHRSYGERGNRDNDHSDRRSYFSHSGDRAQNGERENAAPARRAYPSREGDKRVYRGNATAATRFGRGNGGGAPRVGAIYRDVPRAQRVDEPEEIETVTAPAVEAAEMPEIEAEENENLLVGRNPIREALRAGRSVEKLLVAKGDLSGAARDIIRMAKEAGAVVQTVDRSRLDEIYPAHQGMLAYAAAVDYKTVDDIFENASEKGEDPFIIILDGITDPHNLGAIIRSAECAGAHGVIVPERRAAGLGPAAAKSAAGALDHLPIARVKNLNRCIDELKERGVWVIGTAMEGEDALKADLSGPAALVIGSEGEGISHLTLEKCDRVLTLPMMGKIGSLNASVAAGILMYEIVRARHA